jgi:hypothetical protein
VRRRAGHATDGFAEAPAVLRFRELQQERPDECSTSLVAEVATKSVEAGDPLHLQSPGGPAFGRRFLGRGAALSRATVPAAARLEATEHDALFMAGVCLRDVEPALAVASPAERVHVGITPAAPTRR